MRRKLVHIVPLLLIVLVTLRFVLIKPGVVYADSLFTFNEGYGTSVRDSSGSVTGTITGATWRTDDMCFDSKCLYFDGSDWISFGDEATYDYIGSTDFTIQFWFRHAPATATEVIVQKYNGTDGGYRIQMESDGDISFGVDDDNVSFPGDNIMTTAATYDDNQWHFVSAVKDGTTGIYLYLDGKLIVSNTSLTETGTLVNGATFYVGDSSGADGGDEYIGFLDEIKIYTGTARSQAEISADYAGSTPDRGSTATFGPSQASLSHGLEGYWKLDESSWAGNCSTADVLDSSGNSRHGISCINGDAPTTVAGKYGKAANFDGIANYMNMGAGFNYTSSFSHSYWVALDDYNSCGPDGNSQHLIGTHHLPEPGGNGRGWGTYWDCDGIAWELTNSTGTAIAGYGYAQPSPAPTNGSWHHVVFVYDSITPSATIFWDGQQLLTESGAANVPPVLYNNGEPLTVNGLPYSPPSNDGAPGKMDEVRVYSRTLSPEEAMQLYNHGIGPVAHWPLNENTGTTNAFDTSGSGYTATLTSITESSWIPGKYGSALNLDGSADFIDVGAGPGAVNTVAFWVKPNTASEHIIDLNGSAYISASAGTLSATGFTSPTYYVNGVQTAAPTLTANTWQHIAVTTATALNASDLDLGRLEGTDFLNGSLDDVRLYNYARTPTQIIQDMNAGHPGPGSPVGSATGHWKLDEGYGDTANNAGSGTTDFDLAGSCPGAGTCPTWSNSGKFGKALGFDGGDYASIPTASDSDFDFNGSEKFTISAWVYPTTMPGSGEFDGIVTKWDETSSQRAYALTIANDDADTTGYFSAGIVDEGNDQLIVANSSADSVAQNTWYHVTMTFNGGTAGAANDLKLYVNGTLITGNAANALFNGLDDVTSDVVLGEWDPNDVVGIWTAFTGRIDEVKIFASELTADQIKVLYNQSAGQSLGALSTDSTGAASNADLDSYCPPGQGSTCTPPVAHWPLDENTGTTSTFDISGSGYTGTLTSITQSSWVPGKYGSALTLDGSADFVDVGTGPSTVRSIEFWVRPTTTTEYFVNLTSTTDYIWANAGTITATGLTSPTIYVNGIQTSTIAGGVWSHVVVTSATAENASNLELGRTQDTNYLEGMIDQVRLYSNELSRAQVSWLYNRGKPLAHWRMDESSWNGTAGEVKDASGNTLHGVRSGDATTTSGKFNNAGTFDGTGDYVSMGNNATIEGSTEASVCAWIFYGPSSVTTDGAIASRYLGSVEGWLMWVDDVGVSRTDTIAFAIDPGTNPGGRVEGSTGLVTPGQWDHYCGVFKGGSFIRLYKNSKLDQEETTSVSATVDTDNGNLYIGRVDNASPRYFEGKIDDLRIYNYALTRQQVETIMNEGATTKF